MSRTGIVIVALLGVAAAQGVKPEESLNELKTRLRVLQMRGGPASHVREQQLAILERVAAIGDEASILFLAGLSRDLRYREVDSEILGLLVKTAPDSATVAELLKSHLGPTDPHRVLARDYLMARAIGAGNTDWLSRFFAGGILEDRFLALQAMGSIGSKDTIDCASTLLQDRDWTPDPETVVSCATIAASVTKMEGTDAARLLLLLRRDGRFTARDAAALREATRLWATSDLYEYIDLTDLAHPDLRKRLETIRFLGEAGVEAARAPLLRLARREGELPEVRAAAAEAIGGLRIARGDLSRCLVGLLGDREPRVRMGAVAGLGRLRVRQSAEALVKLLDGPLDRYARAALARSSDRDAPTDWRAWLDDPDCDLPRGT